jgi:hypothetical protein
MHFHQPSRGRTDQEASVARHVLSEGTERGSQKGISEAVFRPSSQVKGRYSGSPLVTPDGDYGDVVRAKPECGGYDAATLRHLLMPVGSGRSHHQHYQSDARGRVGGQS